MCVYKILSFTVVSFFIMLNEHGGFESFEYADGYTCTKWLLENFGKYIFKLDMAEIGEKLSQHCPCDRCDISTEHDEWYVDKFYDM